METQHSERFNRGWNNLKEIDGKAGTNVIESLKDISPDLGTYIVEYGFGDIYNRPVLDHRTKEMIVVAVLAALGNAVPQLKVHLKAALNIGVTEEEIKEIMILLSVYCGFPTALNGTFALKEIVQEKSLSNK